MGTQRLMVLLAKTAHLLKRSYDQRNGSQLGFRVADLVLVQRKGLKKKLKKIAGQLRSRGQSESPDKHPNTFSLRVQSHDRLLNGLFTARIILKSNRYLLLTEGAVRTVTCR